MGLWLSSIGWHSVTDGVVLNLNRTLEMYDITTTERIRHFLAQALHESMDGSCKREGEYHLWSPDNWTQQQYKAYYNAKAYTYQYRGGGYIQSTWDYSYQSFATYMISQAYPEYNIETTNPANQGKTKISNSYKKALTIASQNGLDIKKYTDIYDKGTDYTADHFAWEITGWDWLNKGLNEVVDGLITGNVNDVDKVSKHIK
jgi:hypothetical protein